jgi:hypothetical protein
MHNEWAEMSTSMTVTPQGVQILFWVLFLISASAYAFGVGHAVLNNLVGKGGADQMDERNVMDREASINPLDGDSKASQ